MEEKLKSGDVAREIRDRVDRATHMQLWSPVDGYERGQLDDVDDPVDGIVAVFRDLAQDVRAHPWPK